MNKKSRMHRRQARALIYYCIVGSRTQYSTLKQGAVWAAERMLTPPDNRVLFFLESAGGVRPCHAFHALPWGMT